MSSAKEDVKFAHQFVMLGESIKQTVEIYLDMLEKGYEPINSLTATRFINTMLEASKELTEMMNNHAVVIQAHAELDKM